MNNNKSVFISYSWKNAKEARGLANLLKSYNYKPWIDVENLDLTGDLHFQILKAITQSNYFVLVFSSSTHDSHWVEFEMQTAKKTLDKNKIYFFDLEKNIIQYDIGNQHKKENIEFLKTLKEIQQNLIN
ncbi:toll/interleukin-1 receptor domain-containing protein [Neobacillus sp. OS1-33]|uniref:toll/interleukin-1 receptor domain-containing protein n=1 Tax=Neobacillus sp. OS1-33 TaxID=3070683 RepID=UPI0027DEFD05|nr:toll/interleukin-1 receptor domain-containing protein [Neobacillus sp. OS1-33]WML25656.1 toll/interleukin-1 receptor domain-containing protein [Neobacillus sp. OS1-33]